MVPKHADVYFLWGFHKNSEMKVIIQGGWLQFCRSTSHVLIWVGAMSILGT